jgi:hypothetical protein
MSCKDLKCKFKNSKGKCSLSLGDATIFLDKYKVTTCEAGMGEVEFDKKIITKLKQSGKFLDDGNGDD